MGPEELVTLAHVAKRYYVDDRTRVEIASEMGISRFKVARMLANAKERGIVEITIHSSDSVDAELSFALRERFAISRAIVVPVPEDEDHRHIRNRLGGAAAALLREIAVEDDVLGITAGRTVSAMAAQLVGLPHCEVVQLSGVAGTAENAVETIRRISNVTGGASHPIFSPLLVERAETAEALRREPSIRSTFRRFPSITKAVVAIGSWNPPDSELYDSAKSLGLLDDVLRHGVVAEIGATLLDADGKEVDLLSRHSIAISSAQLARIPEVIAVAGGSRKTAAILATLRSGLVSSLVTDTETARKLLALDSGVPGMF